MSDERNADSVLFKLDTLEEVQAAQASQQPGGGRGQIARLAAAAPASGGSGLIDVRTLAASAGPEAPPPAEAEASASSSSRTGGTALSDSLLSSSSMLAAIPTPDAAPASMPVKAPSRVPLIILSVLAVLALGAAITAIVLRG